MEEPFVVSENKRCRMIAISRNVVWVFRDRKRSDIQEIDPRQLVCGAWNPFDGN